jgi:HK97 family phage major capsid protein
MGNGRTGYGEAAQCDYRLVQFSDKPGAREIGMNAVKLLGMTDESAVVGGWGVVFGDKDLDGETFTKATDFMLSLVPEKPVFYDHTMHSIKHALGTVVKAEIQDEGIWVEAELDRNAEYVSHVLQLVETGALGWSSGSVGHLTRREGGVIKSWPVVEWSLTPTPAEPRTLGVEFIKSLIESDPSFEALLPEAETAISAAGADDVEEIDDVTEAIEAPQTVGQEEAKMATQEVEETTVQDYSALVAEVKGLKAALENEPVKAVEVNAPNVLKGKRGDSEENALRAYIKTGDLSALKASNNTDMNIGTSADGGYAVPTGHYNGIIARRDESLLAAALGVTRITGVGTTVNVPVDNEADGEFVATNEATDFDRDAPAISQVAMTLAKYTKTVELSQELIQDEESNLMEFLNNFIGRGLAKTHNSLLITAAGAGGTAALALDSATVIGVSEIPELVYLLPDPYQDSAKWVMKRAVEGEIRSLVSASDFQYVPKWMGTVTGRPELWGYPVFNSEYAGATAASAKSLFFGDWSYMALREAPGLTVLRDPYSKARQGQICLHYQFRAIYKVLQAEAILYAAHPSA